MNIVIVILLIAALGAVTERVLGSRDGGLASILGKGAFALVALAVIVWAGTSGFLLNVVVGPILSKAFEKQLGTDASKQATTYMDKLRDAPECAEFEELLLDAAKGAPLDRGTLNALHEIFETAKQRGCTTEKNASAVARPPFPDSGSARYMREVTPEEFQARLTVDADRAPKGKHYVITFIEKTSNRSFMEVFINGGSSEVMGLPPGAYTVHVEGGSVWYGDERRFGPTKTTSYDTVVAAATNGEVSVQVSK